VATPVFNLIYNYQKHSEPNPDGMCKICLSNNEEETNPMINLCKCMGSISCVHFQCLKYWMQTKLSTKENEKKSVTSYSMKSFNCEICKTPYPLRFRSEDLYYDIIDYTRPVDKNYIILESLNQMKDNNNYKSLQVITLEENEKIVMGRGHETDVRINDISVSRTHALITLVSGKIFIKDLKSKFGTLVLVQDDLELTDKTISLQIGRTYGEFMVMSPKDFQKMQKDTALKVDDKNNQLNKNLNKELFKVEKPEKKDSKKNPTSFTLNAMDVDNEFQVEHENLHISNILPGANSNTINQAGNININTLNHFNLFANQNFIINGSHNLGQNPNANWSENIPNSGSENESSSNNQDKNWNTRNPNNVNKK